jgi:type II secretory pathway pseudopilin PulG
MKTSMNSKSRSAFTLIEIALAILLIALGILAMFSLLGAGLDTSNKASADAQAAIFADSVFNSLRAESQRAAEKGIAVTNAWVDFWDSFTSGGTNIPIACYTMWGDGNLMLRSPGLYTVCFTNNYGSGGLTNVVNHSLRYTIYASLEPNLYRADVLLKVWDGQFAQTGDTNALIFYSEFRKEGDL